MDRQQFVRHAVSDHDDSGALGSSAYTGTSTTITANSQSDVSATGITSAYGITGAAVSWTGSPDGSLPYTGYANGNNFMKFTATNISAAVTSSWVQASRTFSTALNIGANGAVGVWIYGDGKGELLDFQLLSSSRAVDDHCLTVNFTGWKYIELPLAERSLEQYDNYSWPSSPVSVLNDRFLLDPTAITGINILYNNVPYGQSVRSYIAVVKALPLTTLSMANPTVTINGSTITFPVTLTSAL